MRRQNNQQGSRKHDKEGSLGWAQSKGEGPEVDKGWRK